MRVVNSQLVSIVEFLSGFSTFFLRPQFNWVYASPRGWLCQSVKMQGWEKHLKNSYLPSLIPIFCLFLKKSQTPIATIIIPIKKKVLGVKPL